MKVTLDPGAIMPTRAHPTDAGLDLYALKAVTIPARGHATVETGVHVIDEGYTGPIVVKLYNQGDEDVTIGAGQKLIQLVILPILTPELELAESLEDTDRGAGGFGSTGA